MWETTEEAYKDSNYWDYVKLCNKNLITLNSFFDKVFDLAIQKSLKRRVDNQYENAKNRIY